MSPIVPFAKVGVFGQKIIPLNDIPAQQWPKAFGHVGTKPCIYKNFSSPLILRIQHLYFHIAKHLPTSTIHAKTFYASFFNLP
jgi:hypothetical protein